MGILLAPALLAASIYIEFSLLVNLTEGEKYSMIRRRLITKIFVTGDVLSFLFQAIGGSILAKQNLSNPTLGKVIIEISLFFQIIFFGFFLINAINFSIKLRKQPPTNRRSMPWQKHMAIFTVGILIFDRCIYRVIEGHRGNLMTHEIYIYILDAGLILIAMVTFHLYHPSEISSLLRAGKVAVLFHVENIEQKYSGLQLHMIGSEVNINRSV
ncbi:RTA1 protein [Penicillium expansum]|nr:RTA1 protein [Penicillium expansum]